METGLQARFFAAWASLPSNLSVSQRVGLANGLLSASLILSHNAASQQRRGGAEAKTTTMDCNYLNTTRLGSGRRRIHSRRIRGRHGRRKLWQSWRSKATFVLPWIEFILQPQPKWWAEGLKDAVRTCAILLDLGALARCSYASWILSQPLVCSPRGLAGLPAAPCVSLFERCCCLERATATTCNNILSSHLSAPESHPLPPHFRLASCSSAAKMEMLIRSLFGWMLEQADGLCLGKSVGGQVWCRCFVRLQNPNLRLNLPARLHPAAGWPLGNGDRWHATAACLLCAVSSSQPASEPALSRRVLQMAALSAAIFTGL